MIEQRLFALNNTSGVTRSINKTLELQTCFILRLACHMPPNTQSNSSMTTAAVTTYLRTSPDYRLDVSYDLIQSDGVAHYSAPGYLTVFVLDLPWRQVRQGNSRRRHDMRHTLEVALRWTMGPVAVW